MVLKCYNCNSKQYAGIVFSALCGNKEEDYFSAVTAVYASDNDYRYIIVISGYISMYFLYVQSIIFFITRLAIGIRSF